MKEKTATVKILKEKKGKATVIEVDGEVYVLSHPSQYGNKKYR